MRVSPHPQALSYCTVDQGGSTHILPSTVGGGVGCEQVLIIKLSSTVLEQRAQ